MKILFACLFSMSCFASAQLYTLSNYQHRILLKEIFNPGTDFQVSEKKLELFDTEDKKIIKNTNIFILRQAKPEVAYYVFLQGVDAKTKSSIEKQFSKNIRCYSSYQQMDNICVFEYQKEISNEFKTWANNNLTIFSPNLWSQLTSHKPAITSTQFNFENNKQTHPGVNMEVWETASIKSSDDKIYFAYQFSQTGSPANKFKETVFDIVQDSRKLSLSQWVQTQLQ